MKRIILLSLILFGAMSLLSAEYRNPSIAIEGGLVQSFGSQYLGYASNPKGIQIQNLGSSTLTVTSISVPNPESPFVLINPPMPMFVAAGSAVDFWMIFLPQSLGSASDSLMIESNDPLTPSLKLRLNGTGIYVPPAAVQNVQINQVGEDISLSWDPVNTTIFGLPLVPDRYVVMFSQVSEGNHYWQLGNTAGLSYTHYGVVTYSPAMFYKVKAVVFYRDEDGAKLDNLIASKTKLSDTELESLFDSFLKP